MERPLVKEVLYPTANRALVEPPLDKGTRATHWSAIRSNATETIDCSARGGGSMADLEIHVSGLSSLDVEELREVLGETVTFQQAEVPEGTLAEPVTTLALIKLSVVALGVLAAWLAKPRRRVIATRTMRVIYPDGRIEERTLVIDASSEEESKQQILSQINDWLGHVETPSE